MMVYEGIQEGLSHLKSIQVSNSIAKVLLVIVIIIFIELSSLIIFTAFEIILG
jgi:hypothetical protein